MNISGELRAYLLADAGIAALVSQRVYSLRLPQKVTFPAVVLTPISGLRYETLNSTATLARPRYQVDSWALTEDGATTLGGLCRRRLDGFTGTWTDDESPQTEVSVAITFENEQTLFEEDISGGMCRHSADFFVWHGTAGGQV